MLELWVTEFVHGRGAAGGITSLFHFLQVSIPKMLRKRSWVHRGTDYVDSFDVEQFWQDIFPGASHAAVIASGLLLLMGLMLWSAGIKVSRALAAVFTGLSTASLAAHFVPAWTGLADISCAVLGLAAGIVIGAVTFKMVQASTIAVCLGAAAMLVLYTVEMKPAATARITVKSEIARFPLHPETAKTVDAPKTEAANSATAPSGGALDAFLGHGTADERVQNMARVGAQRWAALEKPMRQQMLVLGAGVAIMVLIVAMTIPRHTTWVISAIIGTALIGVGTYGMLHIYAAQYLRLVPTSVFTQAGIVAIVVLGGMLLQHALFWPRKDKHAKKQEPSASPVWQG